MSLTMSEEDSRLLASSIVSFLRNELAVNDLCLEHQDNIQIAIESLQSAYQLDDLHQSQRRPLLDMFLQVSFPVPVADRLEADRIKQEGNAKMTAGLYQEAEQDYTRAIELDGYNSVYYCNRAGARIELQQFYEATSDCRKAVDLNPDYAKAYGRMGQAYASMNNHRISARCFRKAVELEPDNETYRNNLAAAEERVTQDPTAFMGLLMNGLLSSILNGTNAGSAAGGPSFVFVSEPHTEEDCESGHRLEETSEENSSETLIHLDGDHNPDEDDNFHVRILFGFPMAQEEADEIQRSSDDSSSGVSSTNKDSNIEVSSANDLVSSADKDQVSNEDADSKDENSRKLDFRFQRTSPDSSSEVSSSSAVSNSEISSTNKDSNSEGSSANKNSNDLVSNRNTDVNSPISNEVTDLKYDNLNTNANLKGPVPSTISGLGTSDSNTSTNTDVNDQDLNKNEDFKGKDEILNKNVILKDLVSSTNSDTDNKPDINGQESNTNSDDSNDKTHTTNALVDTKMQFDSKRSDNAQSNEDKTQKITETQEKQQLDKELEIRNNRILSQQSENPKTETEISVPFQTETVKLNMGNKLSDNVINDPVTTNGKRKEQELSYQKTNQQELNKKNSQQTLSSNISNFFKNFSKSTSKTERGKSSDNRKTKKDNNEQKESNGTKKKSKKKYMNDKKDEAKKEK